MSFLKELKDIKNKGISNDKSSNKTSQDKPKKDLEKEPKQDKQPEEEKKTKTRTRTKKKKKLTARILGEKILNSRMNMDGEKAFQNWITRNDSRHVKNKNKRISTAPLTYLLEIFNELNNEGYDI